MNAVIEDILHSLSIKNEAGRLKQEEADWLIQIVFAITGSLYDEDSLLLTEPTADDIEQVHLEVMRWPTES